MVVALLLVKVVAVVEAEQIYEVALAHCGCHLAVITGRGSPAARLLLVIVLTDSTIGGHSRGEAVDISEQLRAALDHLTAIVILPNAAQLERQRNLLLLLTSDVIFLHFWSVHLVVGLKQK